jgi:hypothetical protein
VPRTEVSLFPRGISKTKSTIGGYLVKTRTLTILLVGVWLVAGTQSLWGQNAAGTPGLRKYFDPRNHVLITVPQADSAAVEEPPTTTYTGTFVFNFTITVKANIASTAKIQCTATAIVTDGTTSFNEIIESDTVQATRTGSTATCSPTIPYSWNLSSGSSDKVQLGWTLSAPSGSATFPQRVSEQTSFASISVPTSGSTTTETLTPTF